MTIDRTCQFILVQRLNQRDACLFQHSQDGRSQFAVVDVEVRDVHRGIYVMQ